MLHDEHPQPLLGTTFFSFTNEWVSGQYTLPDLLKRVAQEGIGPGVEIVGFQSIRGFPGISSAFVREFRDLLDNLELVPTCLGSNIDVALRRDRYLNEDELVEYLLRQIEAARLLGFPLLRVQLGADPKVMERVAATAERANVRLGMEIHAPEGPETPSILAMRELYDRLDSDYLGFIPDFSATMHRITPGLIQILVDAGLPSRLVPDLQRIWAQQGKPAERLGEFLELARAAGAPEGALVQANAPFTMNGHEAPNSWVELMPRVFHVHAKFYEIGADGQEPSIDYEANLGPLRDAGFSGSISSEWEAHSWTPIADLDTFALIRRQQELIRTIFGMD